MAIEAATYINGLDGTRPSSTDPKSEGDDHLRLLKLVLKATFPNLAGAVSASDVELSYLAGLTSAIQAQIDSKAAKAGAVHTGAHDFTGATTTVAAPVAAASPVTKLYADGLAFGAVALPGQPGNARRFVKTDGTTANWDWPQLTLATVTGTTHTAEVGTLCVLTNVAATTVTLPASPAVDDVIEVMPANGLTTNVINGNGKNINGDATVTIDNAWACVTVRYISIAIGWRIM